MTTTIIRVVTKGSEAFDICLSRPDQVDSTILWATDQYYKGGVETFWVNGIEFMDGDDE